MRKVFFPAVFWLFLFFVPSFLQAQVVPTDRLFAATQWVQTSGEYRALCYQAYQLARLRLDEDLKKQGSGKGRAVVVDVDETVLNNIAYQVNMVARHWVYGAQTWDPWVKKAGASAIPGALKFLQYAHTNGYRIFYVTNRREHLFEATAKNLLKLGFPDVTGETLVMQGLERSKESRRESISRNHEIVLLIGDNLIDLAAVFDDQSFVERRKVVDRLRGEFGKKFIMLPNPMYGDWDGAVVDYQWQLTEEERMDRRWQTLRSFREN